MTFEAQSSDEVLREAVRAIHEQGRQVCPRGLETREVLGFSFRLTNPRARRINVKARRWPEALAIGELSWHMAGSDDVAFISYYLPRWGAFSPDGERVAESCYGKKIFSPSGRERSQWEAVRDVLVQDPASRRAVLYLGSDTASLEHSNPDVACASTIQFLIRDFKVNCIVSMRSLDVIWGLGYDVFLGTMLQERLACELGLRLGWFQLAAGSMHVYKRHCQLALRILAEPAAVSDEMPPMSDVNSIPAFLGAERALRLGESDAESRVAALPRYWRDLASPLVHLRHERSGFEERAITVHSWQSELG
jgi:thymidylate synthase